MTAAAVPPQVSRVFQPVLSRKIHDAILARVRPAIHALSSEVSSRQNSPQILPRFGRTSDDDFGKEHRPSHDQDRAVLRVIKALAALDPCGLRP
jgi:hypothetical protein